MQWWTRLPQNTKILVGTAIVAVGGFFGYRFYESRKAAASSGSATTATTTGEGEGTGTGAEYTQGYQAGEQAGEGGGTGGPPSSSTGTGTTTTTSPPKTTTTPTKTSTSPTATGPPSNPYGLNEQTIEGKQMAEIGVITGKGLFSGRNVGGGAPVYFYIPKGVPGGGQIKTGLTKAQIDALPSGTQIFTPTSYYKDISATQKANQGI